MKRHAILLLSLMLLACLGCQAKNPTSTTVSEPAIFQDHSIVGLTPEEPADNYDFSDPSFNTGPLKDFNFAKVENFRRLNLNDCIQSALENSDVIRDLGGTILRTPDLIGSRQDPALSYTDPSFGEEAALSAFDTQLSSQFLYQKNDRAFNSTFIGDLGIIDQDLLTHDIGLTKRSATGATYRLNSQLVYDRNNTISNRFDNDTAYDTFMQAEIRQPLLQGAGTTFNRIAGPNNLPGVNTGVLVARANTDIDLAEFEIGVRDLISDVENAYWDLYFAYRDLEAKIEARNGAYEIWQQLKTNDKGAAEIGQAKEQYYRFAADVQDAIHGRLNDGTRTNNGSSGGTFRPNGGVRVAERRLRLIAGLPLNDSQLIIPSEMPVDAKVVFDWMQSKDDALINRTELRRQRWVIKRECLELTANKNHLMPRVDLVSRYRLRGFGNDLYGSDGFDGTLGAASQNGSDALATMLNGDFQEWELGLDVNVPLGFRRQNAAVRNSMLSIQRERAILKEQQRQIVYGLSNALGELERATGLLEVNKNRLKASEEQYEAIQEERANDKTTIDLVLESQRRVIEAKRQYFQTQVEFMLAVKSVHFEKGTLMNYHNVSLTEEGWTSDEYEQAQRRESRKSGPLNYFFPGIHVGKPKSNSAFAGSQPFEGEIIQDGFEVADESTKEGQLKLADAKKFLQSIEGEEESDAGALRMMALQLDKEEKIEKQTKQPFRSMIEKLSSSPFKNSEADLNKTLEEKPIFDARKAIQQKQRGPLAASNLSPNTPTNNSGNFLNASDGGIVGTGLNRQSTVSPVPVTELQTAQTKPSSKTAMNFQDDAATRKLSDQPTPVNTSQIKTPLLTQPTVVASSKPATEQRLNSKPMSLLPNPTTPQPKPGSQSTGIAKQLTAPKTQTPLTGKPLLPQPSMDAAKQVAKKDSVPSKAKAEDKKSAPPKRVSSRRGHSQVTNANSWQPMKQDSDSAKSETQKASHVATQSAVDLPQAVGHLDVTPAMESPRSDSKPALQSNAPSDKSLSPGVIQLKSTTTPRADVRSRNPAGSFSPVNAERTASSETEGHSAMKSNSKFDIRKYSNQLPASSFALPTFSKRPRQSKVSSAKSSFMKTAESASASEELDSSTADSSATGSAQPESVEKKGSKLPDENRPSSRRRR